jgi:REP element-mobilizing transposase RayT
VLGARLHGNDAGSVDRSHNAYGTRILEPNQARSTSALGRMIQTPYVLDPPQRSLVLSCLRDVCTYRNWNLLAAHVRTNHVHVVVVVGAAEKPESVMNTLKAYASRKLNESGLEASDPKTLEPSWKHSIPVESRAGSGCRFLRCRWTGQIDVVICESRTVSVAFALPYGHGSEKWGAQGQT